MKPKIVEKEALLIAGVAGSGDETAKAWEAFMKIQKINPLKNQAGDEGYEVRMYPADGPGKILVGVAITDTKAPPEYKTVALPSSAYAEFEIFPAKGYESGNTAMNQWLEENEKAYKQRQLNGMHYAVEVYDKRFKGEKDPDSIVEILIPIVEVKGKKK